MTAKQAPIRPCNRSRKLHHQLKLTPNLRTLVLVHHKVNVPAAHLPCLRFNNPPPRHHKQRHINRELQPLRLPPWGVSIGRMHARLNATLSPISRFSLRNLLSKIVCCIYTNFPHAASQQQNHENVADQDTISTTCLNLRHPAVSPHPANPIPRILYLVLYPAAWPIPGVHP